MVFILHVFRAIDHVIAGGWAPLWWGEFRKLIVRRHNGVNRSRDDTSDDTSDDTKYEGSICAGTNGSVRMCVCVCVSACIVRSVLVRNMNMMGRRQCKRPAAYDLYWCGLLCIGKYRSSYGLYRNDICGGTYRICGTDWYEM